MNDAKSENGNKFLARDLSHRFEYYLIGLVFTILGLSIQTSSLSKEHFQYLFELFAWISLLVSGLLGLWRLEYIPVAYREYSRQQVEEGRLNLIGKGTPIVSMNDEEWSDEETREAVISLKVNIAERKARLSKLERSLLRRYKIHRWAFVIGIVSLMISRAMLGMNKIQAHSVNVTSSKADNSGSKNDTSYEADLKRYAIIAVDTRATCSAGRRHTCGIGS